MGCKIFVQLNFSASKLRLAWRLPPANSAEMVQVKTICMTSQPICLDLAQY